MSPPYSEIDAAHKSSALLIPASDVCCSTKWKYEKSNATRLGKGFQDSLSFSGGDGDRGGGE